jgi:hypothetical protein
MNVDESLDEVSQAESQVRFGAPELVAMVGKSAQTGERTRIIGFEWPEPYERFVGDREYVKHRTEWRQLERFRADFARQHGDDPFQGAPATRSTDVGHDFDAVVGQTVRGIELSQLTLEDRLDAQARFAPIRAAVQIAATGRGSHRFRHLAHHVVYIGFEAGKIPVTERSRREVVDAIAKLRAPAAVSVLENGRIPQQLLPEVMPTRFSRGDMSAAERTVAPSTPFYRLTGFELALCYSTTVPNSRAVERFNAVIADHDREGVHDLIIVAGAPNQTGYAFPSDQLIARAALEAAAPVPSLEFIQRVFLHIWNDRSVCQLV